MPNFPSNSSNLGALVESGRVWADATELMTSWAAVHQSLQDYATAMLLSPPHLAACRDASTHWGIAVFWCPKLKQLFVAPYPISPTVACATPSAACLPARSCCQKCALCDRHKRRHMRLAKHFLLQPCIGQMWSKFARLVNWICGLQVRPRENQTPNQTHAATDDCRSFEVSFLMCSDLG